MYPRCGYAASCSDGRALQVVTKMLRLREERDRANKALRASNRHQSALLREQKYNQRVIRQLRKGDSTSGHDAAEIKRLREALVKAEEGLLAADARAEALASAAREEESVLSLQSKLSSKLADAVTPSLGSVLAGGQSQEEAAAEAGRARVAGLESERDELARKLEQARGRDCDFCRNWIHSALTGSCHGCWESVSTPRSWKAH